MSRKPDLILDIAGVIATNFSPSFWDDLSLKFEVSYDKLLHFKKEIRRDLWTGRIKENELWLKLAGEFPTVEIEYAKFKLLTEIKPLPAIEEIPMWSEYTNIHLLSNHCIEWVKHIINPVNDYINSITVSGEVGYCKPQPDIYLMVNSHIEEGANVLFVDDQAKNLIEASNLGWNTILADEKGEWTKNVTQQLFSY